MTSSWLQVLAHVSKFLTIQDCARLSACRKDLYYFFTRTKAVDLDCDDFKDASEAATAVSRCPLLTNLSSIRHVRYRGLKDPLLSLAALWRLMLANQDTLTSVCVEGHVLSPLIIGPCQVGAARLYFQDPMASTKDCRPLVAVTVPNLPVNVKVLKQVSDFSWVVFDCPIGLSLPEDLWLPRLTRVKLRGHVWQQQRLRHAPHSPSAISDVGMMERQVTFDMACWCVKTLRLHGARLLPIGKQFQHVTVARVDGLLELLTLTCKVALESRTPRPPMLRLGVTVMPPKLTQQVNLHHTMSSWSFSRRSSSMTSFCPWNQPSLAAK